MKQKIWRNIIVDTPEENAIGGSNNYMKRRPTKVKDYETTSK